MAHMLAALVIVPIHKRRIVDNGRGRGGDTSAGQAPVVGKSLRVFGLLSPAIKVVVVRLNAMRSGDEFEDEYYYIEGVNSNIIYFNFLSSSDYDTDTCILDRFGRLVAMAVNECLF